MSKGPGAIERRIAELLAASRDRALTIDDIVDNAYALNGAKPTRKQRLSATRAAHRLLRRVRETHARARQLIHKAHTATAAALGEGDNAYQTRLSADPASIAAEPLDAFCKRIGVWPRFLRVEGNRGTYRVEHDFWCTSTVKGRLYFHPPDVPVRVWAVTVQPAGVIWVEAEVTRITERNVMVRYRGENARLDRGKLWRWWAWWRGVMFVSSRTGRIASELDAQWFKRYGASGIPLQMQMPLAEAMALLGVSVDYSREDVITAFRKKAKQAHPDLGGTADMFRVLVQARDRLLTALGTKAATPTMPDYAPKGVKMVYRVGGSRRNRLGSSMTRLLQ
jgi:hypothetical protein